MSFFPRAARVLVVLALAAAAVVLPAAAAPASQLAAKSSGPRAAINPAPVGAEATTAALLRLRKNKAVPKRAAIVFDKFRKNPFDSRVTFRAWAKVGPKKAKRWVLIEQASWRAGSGLSRKVATDECRRNEGWLPDGTYSFVQHDRRKAPMINGRAFELEPKNCRNGTRRQLLFIHTEQTQFNTQCRDRKGDDRCRWEVPAYNDYRSNGCIKMSPTDLRNLTRRFHHYFKAGTRYPTSVVKVRVKS